MSPTRAVLLAFLLISLSVTPTLAVPAASAPDRAAPAADKGSKGVDAPRYAKDRVVVKWKDAGKAVANEKAHGLSRIASVRGQTRAEVVRSNGKSVEQLVAQLSSDPAVEWAEPDYIGQVDGGVATTSPAPVEATGQVEAVGVNDPLNTRQYSLSQMDVRDAWSLSKGGNRLIAVIDTGVQWGHPDLAGQFAVNMVEKNGKPGVDDDGNGFVDDINGWDFVNGDNDPADDNNHGTWVSGVLAAQQNNGIGTAGITWTDQLLEVKVMAWNGLGFSSDVAAGIDYAVSRGAKIINLSIGGFEDAYVMRTAIARAWSAGAVIVAAAGNHRVEEVSYPASYPNVISVSATQADDEFANWSSYGPYVDVAAPGTAITTTDCGGCSTTSKGTPRYVDISGTSFATPNTAGVVALIWGRYPTASNQWVADRLIATSDDLGFAGWDNRYGYGRVNAYRAVGGNPPAAPRQTGDSLEPNQTAATARTIGLGVVRPSIYPAGDVDYFAYNLPRAGRFDVSVTPIQDTTRSAKSALSVDVVLELWVNGTRIKTVDTASSSWVTEYASYQASGPMRIVVGIRNWLPNGSRSAYTLTTALIDNVPPLITARAPQSGSDGISVSPVATVNFDEPVTGVSTGSFALYDGAGRLVPARVGYDSTRRQAWLDPSQPLAPLTGYSVAIGSGIADLNGNRLAYSKWSFTTGRDVTRLAGADRYATAAAISAASFSPGVAVAYLATGASFPDALAGGAAAAKAGGPVLLTTQSSLPAATASELSRLKPGRIVVLGGSGVIADGLLATLRGYTAGSVTRLAGADRYATAAAISDTYPADGPSTVYLATGTTFPDGLAAAPVAGRGGAPLLLTSPTSLPPVVADALRRLNPSRVVVLGSSGAVSDAVLAAVRSLWD